MDRNLDLDRYFIDALRDWKELDPLYSKMSEAELKVRKSEWEKKSKDKKKRKTNNGAIC